MTTGRLFVTKPHRLASKGDSKPKGVEKTMTYAKPEIVALGDAVRVVEEASGANKWIWFYYDGAALPRRQTPAYDLDE